MRPHPYLQMTPLLPLCLALAWPLAAPAQDLVESDLGDGSLMDTDGNYYYPDGGGSYVDAYGSTYSPLGNEGTYVDAIGNLLEVPDSALRTRNPAARAWPASARQPGGSPDGPAFGAGDPLAGFDPGSPAALDLPGPAGGPAGPRLAAPADLSAEAESPSGRTPWPYLDVGDGYLDLGESESATPRDPRTAATAGRGSGQGWGPGVAAEAGAFGGFDPDALVGADPAPKAPLGPIPTGADFRHDRPLSRDEALRARTLDDFPLPGEGSLLPRPSLR